MHTKYQCHPKSGSIIIISLLRQVLLQFLSTIINLSFLILSTASNLKPTIAYKLIRQQVCWVVHQSSYNVRTWKTNFLRPEKFSKSETKTKNFEIPEFSKKNISREPCKHDICQVSMPSEK